MEVKLEDQNEPIELLASFNNRRFGANGFYANLKIQTNMKQRKVVYRSFNSIHATPAYGSNLKFIGNVDKTNIFIRSNPSVYRNLHITNKLGVS